MRGGTSFTGNSKNSQTYNTDKGDCDVFLINDNEESNLKGTNPNKNRVQKSVHSLSQD